MQQDIFGHVMTMASSMAPLHLLSQDNRDYMQNWQWCWYDMRPLAPKMATLHSLG